MMIKDETEINNTMDATHNDQKVHLQLWDTSGADDQQTIRYISFPQTDVFVLLFSLIQPKSLKNIEK